MNIYEATEIADHLSHPFSPKYIPILIGKAAANLKRNSGRSVGEVLKSITVLNDSDVKILTPLVFGYIRKNTLIERRGNYRKLTRKRS